MSTSQPLTFKHHVSAEDQARADFYALIAGLFGAPPSQALLNAVAQAAPLQAADSAGLAASWSKLIAACSVMEEDASTEEFNQLFVGVGKAPANLHGSHHLTGFMMEKPLVAVRDSLQKLGLGRLQDASQNAVEDHLAVLCEVMRILIVGTQDLKPYDLVSQRAFFNDHMAAWFEKCLRQIMKHPLANFYSVVAEFALDFLLIEQTSLNI
jgi:TorA maturation chaperone TorD